MKQNRLTCVGTVSASGVQGLDLTLLCIIIRLHPNLSALALAFALEVEVEGGQQSSRCICSGVSGCIFITSSRLSRSSTAITDWGIEAKEAGEEVQWQIINQKESQLISTYWWT